MKGLILLGRMTIFVAEGIGRRDGSLGAVWCRLATDATRIERGWGGDLNRRQSEPRGWQPNLLKQRNRWQGDGNLLTRRTGWGNGFDSRERRDHKTGRGSIDRREFWNREIAEPCEKAARESGKGMGLKGPENGSRFGAGKNVDDVNTETNCRGRRQAPTAIEGNAVK